MTPRRISGGFHAVRTATRLFSAVSLTRGAEVVLLDQQLSKGRDVLGGRLYPPSSVSHTPPLGFVPVSRGQPLRGMRV